MVRGPIVGCVTSLAIVGLLTAGASAAADERPAWLPDAAEPPPRFVCAWGVEGEAAGEMESPIGIAVDACDRLYVTEFHNHRVQVFDVEGWSLRTFGPVDHPGGIAVDRAGRVFVAAMLRGEIVVFDPTGTRRTTWSRPGAGPGELDEPGGLAIDARGDLFVADQSNHRIQSFAADGTFRFARGEHGSDDGRFGGAGPKGSRLSGPHFLAFDAAGRLYSTEGANCRIQRFDAAGRFEQSWSDRGTGPGGFGGRLPHLRNPFVGPIGVVVDARGRVWASSTNNRVQCFTPDGKFVTGLGDEGATQGRFLIPHGLVFDSHGFLYVVDSGNHRIQKFAPIGR